MGASANAILGLEEICLLPCGVGLREVFMDAILAAGHAASAGQRFVDFIVRNEPLCTGIRHPFGIKFPHWKHQLVKPRLKLIAAMITKPQKRTVCPIRLPKGMKLR